MVEKDPQLNALEVGELDLFVDSMKPFDIESIGNQAWVDWHIRLQKLNQQAVLEASSMMEEATKETLISHGKLPVLVHEAICIQVWRLKIYPQMLKLEPVPESTFGIYMIKFTFSPMAMVASKLCKNMIFENTFKLHLERRLAHKRIMNIIVQLHLVQPWFKDGENRTSRFPTLYHEAAAVGLLETVLFHEDGVECISEVAIDLLQYAVEQLTTLIVLINNGYMKPMSVKEMECETVIDELERQKRDLQFDISMRCISIVRYLAEYMEVSGLGACSATNLYKTNDVPSILCHLLQLEPWRRINDKGDLQVFNYGRWSRPSTEDLTRMHRSEAQLWLCLRQLLLEPRLQHYYVIDECRRTSFCRLQAKMTDEKIDQIPPLGELKHLLCQMAIGDYSSLHNRGNGVKNPGCAVIEVVPQIKEAFLRGVHKSRKALAAAQLERCHVDGSEESRRSARRLLDSYASEAALAMDGGGARCARCGDRAAKKCSRCKTEWYCGRECQVQQWPKHKELCDQFSKLYVSG